MKDLIKNLNNHLESKTNHPYKGSDIRELITSSWSCNLKLVKYQTRNVLNIDGNLILRWTRNTIELLYNQKLLYKSPIVNSETILVSFALTEGFIRIQGGEDFDGTYRLSASDISEYEPKELIITNSCIVSFGEAGIFTKEEALKNMSGLDLWLIPDKNCMVYSGSYVVSSITDISHNKLKFLQAEHKQSPSIDPTDKTLVLNPSEFISFNSPGFNIGTDFILFMALEPYEYSSTIQDQLILQFTTEDYINQYILSFTEEEFGEPKNSETLRKLYVKQKIKTLNKTYEEINLVGMLAKDWLIRNERPGPPIYFISTQTNKNGKTVIQNYNYNGKWFIFDEVEYFSNKTEENINIQIGGTYQGKIKEVIFFNRKLVSDDPFEDQSIKWIMAYLKQKYAITDTLIKLK